MLIISIKTLLEEIERKMFNRSFIYTFGEVNTLMNLSSLVDL